MDSTETVMPAWHEMPQKYQGMLTDEQPTKDI